MSYTFLYASSWTHGHGEGGIGLYKMNDETGELTFVEKLSPGADFNVTVFDEKRRLLYALNTSSKLPELRDGGGGRVFVFKADAETGHLTQIGCTPLWSTNPAHMALDLTGKYLVVANHGTKNCITKIKKDAYGKYYPSVEYDDSTVELFAVNDDGTVGELLDVVYHHGCGPEWRQTSPHPHSCEMSPNGKHFVVCDKGNDTVSVYRIDTVRNKLVLASGVIQHEGATLPRYCKFHPTLPYLYQNNESCMDMHVFRYYEDGRLELIDACSTLPDGFNGEKKEGEVFEQQCMLVHPNGKFVYDVARGANTIAVFAVDQNSGRLKRVQDVFTDGHWPRGLAISPDGRFIVLCNVRSNELVVYKVGEDGKLELTGHKGELECVAYATFWKP